MARNDPENTTIKKERKSVIPILKEIQKKKGLVPQVPKETDRVGFAFSTKNRVEFTLQSLDSIDQEKGFDLIWVDGSETKEGRELPKRYKFKNVCLKEYHLDIRGGPDEAIKFGLRRLLDLGYDWCGLIENDIVFNPGWFKRLMELFHLAKKDGLVVGAATVRNYETRVIEYCSNYTINWNIGAGMILFSRKAAQLILNEYPTHPITARKIYRFYAELFGIDLRGVWELWGGFIDRQMSMDWEYEMILYKKGLACVGSIPSFVTNDLGVDIKKALRTNYVTSERSNLGIAYPLITGNSLKLIQLTDPFFSLSDIMRRKIRRVYQLIKSAKKGKFF